MSANTYEVMLRPGRASGTVEVVSPISNDVLIPSTTPTAMLDALVAQYPGVPRGQWQKHLNDALVRESVRVAVATGDRLHRARPDYGPLKPDEQNLIPGAQDIVAP